MKICLDLFSKIDLDLKNRHKLNLAVPGKKSVFSGITINCNLAKPYLTIPYITIAIVSSPNPYEGCLDQALLTQTLVAIILFKELSRFSDNIVGLV